MEYLGGGGGGGGGGGLHQAQKKEDISRSRDLSLLKAYFSDILLQKINRVMQLT
jgi:hypothetical protein